jgi:anthranilate phosphoribosyltransferase
VLAGKAHASRNGFLLNAAASLAIVKDLRLREAMELAVKTVDGGQALACLERWRVEAKTRSPSGGA